MEDQVFVEDLSAEQETLDKYKIGVQVREQSVQNHVFRHDSAVAMDRHSYFLIT